MGWLQKTSHYARYFWISTHGIRIHPKGFESIGQISTSVKPIGIRIRIMFFRDSNLCLRKTLLELGFEFEVWGIRIWSSPRHLLNTLEMGFESTLWRIWIQPSDFAFYTFCSRGFISFALVIKYISETLNSLISKHIKSVLVSSK